MNTNDPLVDPDVQFLVNITEGTIYIERDSGPILMFSNSDAARLFLNELSLAIHTLGVITRQRLVLVSDPNVLVDTTQSSPNDTEAPETDADTPEKTTPLEVPKRRGGNQIRTKEDKHAVVRAIVSSFLDGGTSERILELIPNWMRMSVESIAEMSAILGRSGLNLPYQKRSGVRVWFPEGTVFPEEEREPVRQHTITDTIIEELFYALCANGAASTHVNADSFTSLLIKELGYTNHKSIKGMVMVIMKAVAKDRGDVYTYTSPPGLRARAPGVKPPTRDEIRVAYDARKK